MFCVFSNLGSLTRASLLGTGLMRLPGLVALIAYSLHFVKTCLYRLEPHVILEFPLWQAIISGTFSIIRQSLMLGCFPRVKVVHTSGIVEGQIYIPEANWILMILTLIAVAGFRDPLSISNAYGAHPLSLLLLSMIFKLSMLQITILTVPQGNSQESCHQHDWIPMCTLSTLYFALKRQVSHPHLYVVDVSVMWDCGCCRCGGDICHVHDYNHHDTGHPGHLEPPHTGGASLLCGLRPH